MATTITDVKVILTAPEGINLIFGAKYPCANTVTTWTQTRLADGALQTP